MKPYYLSLIISLFLFNGIAKAQDTYFTSDPTLSTKGQIIIFSYDGDLWKVSATGGETLRLTAMRGEETLPRISPDGKWLAFSATQYGNKDVYVMPINEQTLSDAEVTSADFKELGLGKVVGTETYRWIIFTSGASLVDGSFYRLPSWGCYTLSGDNLEFTGVKPDIYVKEDFKDRLTGNQPQLDKAIEEIMNSLKQ
tara:strand:- start:10482 stop:11072 length:591 start_codon:yes stop_codon:yes gene_type:complete